MLILHFRSSYFRAYLPMSTKRYVLDPADDWGKIPSHLLDRGAFFLTPDPSEEGVVVDEEYDQENIWDRQGKKVQEDENVQANFIISAFDLEKNGPHVSLEENCNGNASQLSRNIKEIGDKKSNLDKKYDETKAFDVGDFERSKDEGRSSYTVDPNPPTIIANSKKGRRYSKDFKKEVSEFSKTHSVRETMQFFDIPKASVQRWTSIKDEGPVNPKTRSEEKLRKEKDRSQDQDQFSFCQTEVKNRRISGDKFVQVNQKEEVLRYKETHTYNDTSSKFGIPVTSIQYWTAKRRQSVSISRAVIEEVLASLGDQLGSGSVNESQDGVKKEKDLVEESSEENSIDILKACDYGHLSPAKRISKNSSQKRGPPRKKRKK